MKEYLGIARGVGSAVVAGSGGHGWRLALLLTCAGAVQASALEIVNVRDYRLGTDETARVELVVVADDIQVRGTAEDDLFLISAKPLRGVPSFLSGDRSASDTNAATAARSTILLSGSAKNDVWAVGDDVSLTGTVGDHARMAAFDTLLVNGGIGRSLIACAGTVRLGDRADVSGDADLYGDELLISGRIGGRLKARGSKITLAGHVGGNARLEAEDIVVMPGAEIHGNLTYECPKELILDKDVKLDGRLIRAPAVAAPRARGLTEAGVALQIALYLGALLVGMLFTILFPSAMIRSVQHVEQSHWKCLLAGYVAFCLIPIVAFFSLFTVVGIPLSVVLLLGYAVLLYVSKFVTAFVVGHLILRRRGRLRRVRSLSRSCWG